MAVLERERHAFDAGHFARLRAAWAREHGPATCGCVAFMRWAQMMLPPDRVKATPGWPLCPICGGAGVDPRLAATSPALSSRGGTVGSEPARPTFLDVVGATGGKASLEVVR